MFLEISQNPQENTWLQNSQPATLSTKRLWNRCFRVNFEKFLRTPYFLQTPPVAVSLYLKHRFPHSSVILITFFNILPTPFWHCFARTSFQTSLTRFSDFESNSRYKFYLISISLFG